MGFIAPPSRIRFSSTPKGIGLNLSNFVKLSTTIFFLEKNTSVIHKGRESEDDRKLLKCDNSKIRLCILHKGVFKDLAKKKQTSLQWQGIVNTRKQTV